MICILVYDVDASLSLYNILFIPKYIISYIILFYYIFILDLGKKLGTIVLWVLIETCLPYFYNVDVFYIKSIKKKDATAFTTLLILDIMFNNY